MNGILAKVGGWAQFLLQLTAQVTQGGLPHGAFGWITLLGSLAAAIGIHASSNVGQVQPQPGANTQAVSPTAHVVQ
jgi:hypothetical protein